MKEGGASLEMLVEGQTHFQAASEFLDTRQYERAAEILQQAQTTSRQTGDEILVRILDAARRICLACSQCRIEVKSHQQACKEAKQREHELRQQTYAILNLINTHDPLEAPKKRERLSNPLAIETGPLDRLSSEHVGRPSLWQRIQGLLGWGLGAWSSEQELPAVYVEQPAHSFSEQAEIAVVSPSVPEFVVYCLGPFRVYNNEQLIEKWSGHKCKSIFKYMIAHREHPIHREVLMDLFWRDADPDAARRNLYQAIYELRQTLQANPDRTYILCEESCYCLNPDLKLWVDSEAFGLYYQTGQRLEREGRLYEAVRAYELAENLYEGEFLAEDRYEEWILVQRDNLKYEYLDILDKLSQRYFDQAQFSVCSTFCQKVLVEDNCREDMHRRLMRCYLRQGQHHLALRQYHLCVEALKRELDVHPMPATIELYHEIQKSRVQFPKT